MKPIKKTIVGAIAVLPLLAIGLTGCGAKAAGGVDLPGAGTPELKNIVNAVAKANPDVKWWPHVVRDVIKGPIADAKVFTDYKAESTADAIQIVALCDAFIKAIQTDSKLVTVYGSVTTKTKRIDGSVKTSTDDLYKLAEGNQEGCDAQPYYKSVETELDAKGISVQPFATKADAPGEVK